MIFFKTERLVLRNVSIHDAETIHDYRNNEICAQFQRDQTKDLLGIRSLLEEHSHDILTDEKNCMITVALKDSNELVGEIIVMPNENTFSFGYTFSYRHHRKGYAYEVLSPLITHLHQTYPSWEFICFVEPENAPSIALLKKLGYKDMGYLPHLTSQVFGLYTTPETDAELAAITK